MSSSPHRRTRSIVTVAATLAVLVAVLAVVPAPAAAVAARPTQPNIVLILLDDLDASVTPYWDAMPRTEALLRDRGMTFTNSYAPTPICCPARASLLTGKYGHNTGVLTNGGSQGGWETFFENGNESQTIATELSAAGYSTMLAGKYLNGIERAPRHVPEGWDEWYVGVDAAHNMYLGYDYTLNENGTFVRYGHDEDDYLTDVLAAKSVDFVERAEHRDATPFFMEVSPTAPHLPLAPAPRHEDHPWADAEVPETPNYYEPDISDKPLWLQLSARNRDLSRAWTDIDYRNRMGSLLAVDEMVADIVAALDDSGELDDTYLVFTADNGYNNGSHHLIHKMAPYEESVRVPLVIAGPGIPAGSSNRAMVLNTDLAPTFMDLAGARVPPDVDGKSLAPLLDGGTPAGWRTRFIAQYVSGGALDGVAAEIPDFLWYLRAAEIPTYRALHTERFVFIEWHGDEEFGGRHAYELYDLKLDPYQRQNLLGSRYGLLLTPWVAALLTPQLDALEACAGRGCP
ncbi:MAG: Arylsulfatase [Acidimicrobiales bacterium]|nr:MAG: sulfatase [Actinomycetota bacterium]MBV6508026.1 Arylsulfatase [Acidimicrobiales bacterium]RIK05345.1 MAG: sulfatase [Acidobacteriota bacterium]